MKPIRVTFAGSLGAQLAARLDLPAGAIRGYALFAHCFTCSKDGHAARYIAGKLASLGIAVLRFDFTGLGASQGEFENTNFSSNVEDLMLAADHLRQNYRPPTVLIGHSLGGAAVLAAAERIPEARGVVTIGAPSDVSHVLKHFSANLAEIERDGVANVTLAGRTFSIAKQFVRDARGRVLKQCIADLRRALLVMHAPRDQVVGIEHATAIFAAAKHPKSFISLDTADHLLSDQGDASYAAEVVAAWASRFMAGRDDGDADIANAVLVWETGAAKYQNAVAAGHYHFLVDEPVSAGGLDSGPNPYAYLATALAGCTSITLRLYAERKNLPLGRLSVRVTHGKLPVEHCRDCGEVVQGRIGKIDRFERVIVVDGNIDPALRETLVEIANKCPVHRTLTEGAAVVTKLG